MANLTKAHNELFRRMPDECFATLADLRRHCSEQHRNSSDRWQLPQSLTAKPVADRLALTVGNDGDFLMNDWSFSQLCGLARVSKETVNSLSPATAGLVLREMLPSGSKPLQVLIKDDMVRSVHGVAYTRLWNTELLEIVQDFPDFIPPQPGVNGGTGLYAGEQDMFVFLIDPTGWVEIENEAFAPGFFLWNSEVGKRTVGISTFWFQAVCANHIVWDATEVVEISRKHTANVREALHTIRSMLVQLTARRDQRRDGFAKVMAKAMQERLGTDAEEVEKLLAKSGIQRTLAKRALEIAGQQGRFTIFSVLDALTRLAGAQRNAGDRLELDQKAASLLDLVTV